jgi:hypothetical protein
MAAMRNDVRPRMLAASAATLMAFTLLSACATAGEDIATGPPVAASPEPIDSAPPPVPTDPVVVPAGVPSTVPAQPGDCPFDPSNPSAVTFVVTSWDHVTPIRLTYSAFRPGVIPETRTATAVGPSIVVLQTDCGEYPDPSSRWSFSATSDVGLSCALFLGAQPLGSDSVSGDDAARGGNEVDCSRTPGM